MKLTWATGEFKTTEVGTLLVGWHKHNKRPETVSLTHVELNYLFQHPEYIRHLQHALAK